jgi:hypothetical protein
MLPSFTAANLRQMEFALAKLHIKDVEDSTGAARGVGQGESARRRERAYVAAEPGGGSSMAGSGTLLAEAATRRQRHGWQRQQQRHRQQERQRQPKRGHPGGTGVSYAPGSPGVTADIILCRRGRLRVAAQRPADDRRLANSIGMWRLV